MSKNRIDTLDPEALSRPERSVQRKQGREVLERVKDCGGCFCCLNRDPNSEGWGRATCGLAKPAEFLKPGCDFNPDHDRIYSRENIE